jgi:hypothetical protein
MRFRATSLPFLCVPSLLACIACGDDAPIYPPIVIIYGGGGANGTLPTGSGSDSSNPNPRGGDTSSSNAGTSNNAGSGTDPLTAHCGTFSSGPEPKTETACDLDALEDGGELKGDIAADRTLKTGHFYVLKGGEQATFEWRNRAQFVTQS